MFSWNCNDDIENSCILFIFLYHKYLLKIWNAELNFILLFRLSSEKNGFEIRGKCCISVYRSNAFCIYQIHNTTITVTDLCGYFFFIIFSQGHKISFEHWNIEPNFTLLKNKYVKIFVCLPCLLLIILESVFNVNNKFTNVPKLSVCVKLK